MNDTANKLNKFMSKNGINQVELATILDVPKETLNRWVRGKRNPSPIYKKIIDKLDVS